ncbi:hypothetical protein Nepgr_033870 [Nepenthes gracilis]|uniref:Uncharacterized protein n=1 Tax=Nepenthes gracilis TaxID=150966 RepID=A0AAD3Y959_NEPGR|nr:hypothetical protein Nepgr_033870 [Nepenthes gracilis]
MELSFLHYGCSLDEHCSPMDLWVLVAWFSLLCICAEGLEALEMALGHALQNAGMGCLWPSAYISASSFSSSWIVLNFVWLGLSTYSCARFCVQW